jgi:site-specific DNA recombinase
MRGTVTPEKHVTRCALYLRKACDEGDDASFDTAKLGEEFSNVCMAHFGMLVVVSIYHDTASSGMHIERPALQRLLQDVRDKHIDIVAYPAPHHLSRDFSDHSMLTRYFATHGVPVIDGSALKRVNA